MINSVAGHRSFVMDGIRGYWLWRRVIVDGVMRAERPCGKLLVCDNDFAVYCSYKRMVSGGQETSAWIREY